MSKRLLLMALLLLPILSACRLMSGEFRETPTPIPLFDAEAATNELDLTPFTFEGEATEEALRDDPIIEQSNADTGEQFAGSGGAGGPQDGASGASGTIGCIPRADWFTYQVVRGDTLARIARRGNTSIAIIGEANCLADPNQIAIGQLLYVPNLVSAATPAPVIVPSTPIFLPPPPQPQPVNCHFYASNTTPGYQSPAFIELGGYAQANRAYTVADRTEAAYLIFLENGSGVWINPEFGGLNGDCGNVRWLETWDQLNQTLCWWIPNGTPTGTVDMARQQIAGGPLQAGRPYRVNGRTASQYRVINDFSVWVYSNDGIPYGDCSHLTDLSRQASLNAPRATYSDSVLPVAFDYPANWILHTQVDSGRGGIVGTAPYREGTYPTALGLPRDVVQVFFTRWAETSNAEQIAQQRLNNYLQSGRWAQVEPIQLYTFANGFAGWFFSVTGPEGLTETYTISINGQVFDVTLQGDLELARIVRDTLRGTGGALPAEPILQPGT